MRLGEARTRTDELFRLLPTASLYERPIAERHRLIFYVGHLEAFDWNLLAPNFGLEADNAELNKLFAFGIDPVNGDLPSDVPSDWPTIKQVQGYNHGVRVRLDAALNGRQAQLRSKEPGVLKQLYTLLNVAIEHRLMHAETLAYLLHNLPFDAKLAPETLRPDARPAPATRQVEVPAGVATLGQERDDSDAFGWDNEFESGKVEVPSFAIDVFPVTNGEYLKFVRAGGYENPNGWSAEGWEWRKQHGITHPSFWATSGGATATDARTQWEYRGMFGRIPLPTAWPVFVSFAEASAFAQWAGKKLPTEQQWHRAAYGAGDGWENRYPWGIELPTAQHGNFHHRRWEPTAVTEHPAGASAFGGNGRRPRLVRCGIFSHSLFILATPLISSTASIT